MVVLGMGTVFLSHLPMFMPVHGYQVILQADFVGRDSRPQDDYVNDRKTHSDQKLYTLAPRPFVLPDILPQGDRPPRLASFSGDVFRGHFERPPTKPEKIAQDVVVNVDKIVHGRKFNVDAPPPSHLEYILFGAGDELFLAHLISRPPDFDQLIQVTLDHQRTDEELARGPHLTVPDRANTSSDRIQPAGDAISASLNVDGSDHTVQIEPAIEFYFEEGELQE